MKSIKTIKAQVFIAVFMIAIGLITAGGATYAWFAMNSAVTADGISITAETEGTNFEITVDTVNGYLDNIGKVIVDSATGAPITDASALAAAGYTVGTNATATVVPNFTSGQISDQTEFASLAMFPVHPTPVTTGYSMNALDTTATWEHAFSHEFDVSTGAAGTYEDLTLAYNSSTGAVYVASGDRAGNYALKTTFYVRLNPTTTGAGVTLTDIIAENVQISGSSTLIDSAYVLVASENCASEISSAAAITNGPAGVAATSDVLIDTITSAAGEYHKIDVYVFFDGEDEDCTSAKYDNVALTVSVDFTEQ